MKSHQLIDHAIVISIDSLMMDIVVFPNVAEKQVNNIFVNISLYTCSNITQISRIEK